MYFPRVKQQVFSRDMWRSIISSDKKTFVSISFGNQATAVLKDHRLLVGTKPLQAVKLSDFRISCSCSASHVAGVTTEERDSNQPTVFLLDHWLWHFFLNLVLLEIFRRFQSAAPRSRNGQNIVMGIWKLDLDLCGTSRPVVPGHNSSCCFDTVRRKSENLTAQ
ncbi:unnamed protein product, partial [Scytosiphon promiscuus]